MGIINAFPQGGSGGGTTIVQKPTVTVETYTYNGSAQGPTIEGLSETNTIVTNATKTDAGTYTLTIALKNTSTMVWNDLTTADLTYEYTINKASLTIPTVTGSFTYNGSEKTAAISTFDSTLIAQTGTTKATNANTYHVYFNLVDSDNCKWSDNTITQKDKTWTIAKATQTISASTTSVTLDTDHLTATVTISGRQGTLNTPTSSATNIATATVSNSTVTIKNVNQTSGSATISVSAASTTNYKASNTVTINVTASFVPLKSWAAAKDPEIDQMLTAAQAGIIDLYNDAGWRVGDERQVSLSAMAATGVGESHVAQTVTMVLVNKGGKSTKAGKECSFIMQPKNFLANGTSGEWGYMNSSNTNVGGWTDSERRTWCNNVYKAALPEYLRSHLLEVANKTSAGNQSTTTINTDYDYCALPSAIEVGQRTTTSPYSSEGTQWSYYTDDASRIKKAGDSGSAAAWWLRSPNAGYTTYFCLVNAAGARTATTRATLVGFVPSAVYNI